MTATETDIIVFHRVRFATPVDGVGQPMPGPETAEAWRFYPATVLGENGLPTFVSDEWGGFGIYRTREAAEAVFLNPEAHLGFLGDTVEAFHSLAVPYSHHGKVDWRGSFLENTTFAVSTDPGGPLMVLTSAGYDNPGPAEVPRIAKFYGAVIEVRDYYASLPGNLRAAVYSGTRVDGRSGVTVTLWRSDAAMMAAAYRPGHHRTQMDYQRTVGHFDFSSFTRTRILATRGTWNGGDPVEEAALPEAAIPGSPVSAARAADAV
jgi:heme-degrading monooxygenase HmoA